QSGVDSAKSSLDKSQAALDSTQAQTAGTVQSAQNQVDQAQQAVASAQASYQQTVAPPTKADLDNAHAQTEASRASLALAQSNLDAATLIAPSDGVVGTINGSVGEWVAGRSAARPAPARPAASSP